MAYYASVQVVMVKYSRSFSGQQLLERREVESRMAPKNRVIKNRHPKLALFIGEV